MARVCSRVFRETFSFPDPVNEIAARWVAAMVAALSIIVIITDIHWLIILLTFGFLARVLTGPKMSLMGQVAVRVLAPVLSKRSKLVAGPPKRFAQLVGLGFSTAALVLAYSGGSVIAIEIILGVLAAFALMESCLGFCAGCFVFGYLMRWGVIPEETCKRCADFGG